MVFAKKKTFYLICTHTYLSDMTGGVKLFTLRCVATNIRSQSEFKCLV